VTSYQKSDSVSHAYLLISRMKVPPPPDE